MRTIALMAGALIVGVWLAMPALAAPFFFSSGTPDGRLGALSQPPSSGELETETADDFILTESTIITGATIVGLIPSGAPLSNISNVEVEFYHVFPNDSADPPSGNVPGRANCHGKSVSALAEQFGDLDAAASSLGFVSVDAVQDALGAFCEP